MKVVVAVLTFEVLRTRRKWLLEGTLQSLEKAGAPFELVLVDNDSQDGSADLVRGLGGISVPQPDGIRTEGRGFATTISQAWAREPDLIVFSNDDMLWRPGFLPRLIDFWTHAPGDVLLCSGLLCDEYPWNMALGVMRPGAQEALVRLAVAGGAWTFRAVNTVHVLPIPDKLGEAELAVCRRAVAAGWRLCEMDLSIHAGEFFSAWGNLWQSTKRLNRDQWGIR